MELVRRFTWEVRNSEQLGILEDQIKLLMESYAWQTFGWPVVKFAEATQEVFDFERNCNIRRIEICDTSFQRLELISGATLWPLSWATPGGVELQGKDYIFTLDCSLRSGYNDKHVGQGLRFTRKTGRSKGPRLLSITPNHVKCVMDEHELGYTFYKES